MQQKLGHTKDLTVLIYIYCDKDLGNFQYPLFPSSFLPSVPLQLATSKAAFYERTLCNGGAN